MRSFAEVEALMAKLEIPYEIVEHPASHSTAESDSYIVGHEGSRSKSLVLANKKSTQFYMLIMDDDREVNMEEMGERLDVKRLHLASEQRLQDMLGLTPGIVSFFGLAGTNYDNFHIYFDRSMLEQNKIITFHPNDNTKTIFFAMDDCFKILDAFGYAYEIIDF
ncbi:prolyl-tRNA synthetase [Weissella oryzae SG25]|uniref:Prolyl-tRNA synthetase n=1 Tax=Weissella oryzae (strain DSM 25784 / JCM 18191 / LMG 30913 / SG25) TaxID=1329250 RepID=A0A069D282_WEIOS|nr:YbaK/EbsC family protein [Weissella oryzae]GAK31516.1 prolyl-tRNA synthetase [Weissella oryzae SG25]